MAPLESNGHQVTEKEMPPTIRRLVENFAFLPHRAEAPYHRALQVGWSRFRAVLMLSTF